MSTTQVILLLLKASVIFVVFAVGLKADLNEATYLWRRPALLLRIVLAMNVIMPAIAVALALAFALHPALKIALVALAASPVPPMLPTRALQSGGERAYTIGLLTTVSLLSIVFVPLTVEVYQVLFQRQLEMPGVAVAAQVFISVLLPLFAGLLVRHVAPRLADRLVFPVIDLATALLAAGVVPLVAASWSDMTSLIGNGTVFALVAFVAAGIFVGHRLGGPQPGQRTVLALAAAMRHPGIAFAIAHANFPDQKLVGPALLLYLLVSAVVWVPYTRWLSRPSRREAPSRKGPMSGLAGRG